MPSDHTKTKQELVAELRAARREIAVLKKVGIESKQAEEALQEGGNDFVCRTNNIPIGIFETDKNGDCLFVNDRWCIYAGMSPAEAFGKGWSRAIHPEDREKVSAEWYVAAKEKREFRLEYRFQTPEGKITWLDGSANATVDEYGNVTGYLGSILDITKRKQVEEALKDAHTTLEKRIEERTRKLKQSNKLLELDITDCKQAEEALRESEERFHQLSEMTFEAIVFHEHGVVLYANDQYFRMFGYEPEELLGKDALQLTVTSESEAAIRGNIVRGFLGTYEVMGRRKDGFEFPIEVRTRASTFKGRSVRVGVIRDITERKQAEEAVGRERDNLMRILDSMEDGVDIINDQFDIEYANSVHVRQFGPYQGKKCYEYYHDRESICRGCIAGEVFAGTTARAESKNFYKNKDRVYDVISTPFQGFSESGNAMLEIFRDITDRKEMEEELRRSRLDLEQRVQERTGELRRSNQLLRKDIAARKRAEEALRKNQALLNAFIEGLPNQVFAKDARGRYLMTNAYLERFLEKPKEDILGLDDRALLPPETAELLMASDRKIMASGEVHIFEETRTVDGKTESWRNTKVPYRDHTGDVVGVIGIAEDITERKRAEEELRQSEKRLRRLSAQLITTQESERKRIGKELHDSLGQLLTLTKISIEACVQGLENTVPPADLEPLNRLVPHIGETIVELRRIIMDLRPSVLDDMGILAALKWFCLENESVHSGVPMELFLGLEEREVREELKIVLFRVAQEAVTNALKHAEPGRIRVGLNRRRGSIVLWVEDDGKGFDSDAAMQPGKITSGFGLASMRERAEVAGGEFLIRSGSKGTRVEAVFSL